MSQQVESQAPAHVGQPFELVAPEVGVEEHPVDEHGRWALAGLEIGDFAEPGVHAQALEALVRDLPGHDRISRAPLV